MGKIFLVILYIYAAWHIFAFGGRTAEITHDQSGNVIQQVYDRDGNMIGVYDEKGVKLKETQYTFDGDIISEKIFENGRLIKEAEYEPYMKNDGSNFVAERSEIFEFKYTPGSTEVEIVLSVTEGEITATDSVVYQMQSADNYIRRGAFGTSGGREYGQMFAYIYSLNEIGPDYEIETNYDADGNITKVEDSREKEKEKETE